MGHYTLNNAAIMTIK